MGALGVAEERRQSSTATREVLSAALSLLHPKSNSSDEASPSMMATLSGDERTGEGYSVRLLATARATIALRLQSLPLAQSSGLRSAAQ